MVRLINNKNIGKLAELVYRILRIQEIFTHIKEVNNPLISPCIYAMWHENQLCIHGIEDKAHLNVLISNSADGEVGISRCKRFICKKRMRNFHYAAYNAVKRR